MLEEERRHSLTLPVTFYGHQSASGFRARIFRILGEVLPQPAPGYFRPIFVLVVFTGLLFFLAQLVALGQVKTDGKSRLEFEVASIRPAKPGSNSGGIKPLPGGQAYVATNVTVKLMITLMYHLNSTQISRGPNWLDTDLYDVDAKADGPHSIDELHVMFQHLLEDRFKLQYHMETKTLPNYTLKVEKSVAKLTENHSPEHFDIPIQQTGFGSIQATHSSMSYFSWFLSNRLQKPVVDETGLAGFYDFKLNWTPELPPGAAERAAARGITLPPANGPDIFTALREQLGLRLASHKGPVEVMVIDHVERPSEN
jgi:uncharacterized protein (TIGR03435 family)